LSSDFTEGQPQLSPNGRWLAYVSDETGRSEIYVQPFSLGGSTMPAGKWPISSGGGTDPRWRQDGKELFFISNGNLVSASVRTADAARFDSDAPQMLFELTPLASPLRNGTFRYAVAASGKRFLIMMDPKEAARPPLTVVVNWEAAIKH
jgi:eukaryotic-like serine/threonine-protein kinase